MTAVNTNALNYLGKYVSFNTDSAFEVYGVICCVTNLKILGEITLY